MSKATTCHLLSCLLLASSRRAAAAAQDYAEVALTNRIELTTSQISTDFKLCHLAKCRAIGDPAGYRFEALRSIKKASTPIGALVDALIARGSAADGTSTLARFEHPLTYQKKHYSLVLGYGGTGYSNLLVRMDREDSTKPLILSAPMDELFHVKGRFVRFEFFDITDTLDDVAETLTLRLAEQKKNQSF